MGRGRDERKMEDQEVALWLGMVVCDRERTWKDVGVGIKGRTRRALGEE